MRFIRDYSRIRIVEFNFWIRIPTPPHAPAIPLPVSTRISPCPNSTLREYPEAEELVTGRYLPTALCWSCAHGVDQEVRQVEEVKGGLAVALRVTEREEQPGWSTDDVTNQMDAASFVSTYMTVLQEGM